MAHSVALIQLVKAHTHKHKRKTNRVYLSEMFLHDLIIVSASSHSSCYFTSMHGSSQTIETPLVLSNLRLMIATLLFYKGK